jgi:hypothetical protein
VKPLLKEIGHRRRCKRNFYFTRDLAEIHRDDLDPDPDNILHLGRKNSPHKCRNRKLIALFGSHGIGIDRIVTDL